VHNFFYRVAAAFEISRFVFDDLGVGLLARFLPGRRGRGRIRAFRSSSAGKQSLHTVARSPTLALNVVPPPDAPGRMLSRVRVQLWVGIDSPPLTGSPVRTEYYRAEVECLALPSGRSEVRFYFPPEWVKRDQLQGAPRSWAVELAVAGRAVAPARAASATALGEPAARRAFLVAALAGAPTNDGLLQTQYFTPFAQEYSRSTVTFVRLEPSFAPTARASP